ERPLAINSMDGQQDRGEEHADRQCEDASVPELGRLPQCGDRHGDKRDDANQRGDGEPETSHGRVLDRGVKADFTSSRSGVSSARTVCAIGGAAGNSIRSSGPTARPRGESGKSVPEIRFWLSQPATSGSAATARVKTSDPAGVASRASSDFLTVVPK